MYFEPVIFNTNDCAGYLLNVSICQKGPFKGKSETSVNNFWIKNLIVFHPSCAEELIMRFLIDPEWFLMKITQINFGK